MVTVTVTGTRTTTEAIAPKKRPRDPRKIHTNGPPAADFLGRQPPTASIGAPLLSARAARPPASETQASDVVSAPPWPQVETARYRPSAPETAEF